jgi:hypothetical protein
MLSTAVPTGFRSDRIPIVRSALSSATGCPETGNTKDETRSLSQRVSWHPIVRVCIIPARDRDVEVEPPEDHTAESYQDCDVEVEPPEHDNIPDRDIEAELSGENAEHTVYADTCAPNIPVKHTTTRRRSKSVTFTQMVEVFIIPRYVTGNIK